MTRFCLLTVFATAALTVGCVPDPLEGFDDAGTGNNTSMNSMTNNAGNMDMGGGGGGSFNPEFIAVNQVLKTNCLLGGCHGNPPGAAQVFILTTGVNATDAEMQAAFENQLPTSSGNRLITPGSADTSEIYVRVTKPAGDIQLMGAGTYGGAATPLGAADIATIQTWINNGAVYTQ